MKTIALRIMGLGDILYAEPTLRLLGEKHPVIFKTFPKFVSVFDNHPFIESVSIPKQEWAEHIEDVTFDLNRVYEDKWLAAYRKDKNSKTPNLMQCVLEKAVEKGLLSESEIPSNPRPQIYLSEEEKDWAKTILDSPNWIIVDVGYKHRRQDFKPNEWNCLFDALRFVGYQILTVGLGMHVKHLCPDLELRGKTSLREFFALMDRADFFLGIESGALATAIAFDKPGVWIAGVTPAYALLPTNSKMKVVRSHPELHGGFYLENDKRFFNAIRSPMPGDEVLSIFESLTNS